MTGAMIKSIGIAATVVGMGTTLISDWVNEKKMEEKIEEKVNEALANGIKDKKKEF